MLRQLLNAAFLGTLAALVMLAHVNLYGETLNERTGMIVLTSTLSAMIAGLFLTPLFEDRRTPLWRWRAAAAFVWVFMGVMVALYVVNYEFLSAQADRLPGARSVLPLRSMARTAAHFLAFCPKYLLPWPLPMLALCAALLLPGLPRRKG